jgi:hypothetical protein
MKWEGRAFYLWTMERKNLSERFVGTRMRRLTPSTGPLLGLCEIFAMAWIAKDFKVRTLR